MIEPPPAARRAQLRLDDNWSVEGLKAQGARRVVPDAILKIARPDSEADRVFLIEYDRRSKLDKNYEKLRRYDALLTWWWRYTPQLDRGEPPWVLFVCLDDARRENSSAPPTVTSPVGSGTHRPPPARSTTPDAGASCLPAKPTSTPASLKPAEPPATRPATPPFAAESPRAGG